LGVLSALVSLVALALITLAGAFFFDILGAFGILTFGGLGAALAFGILAAAFAFLVLTTAFALIFVSLFAFIAP
jgi:hypothetical protein